MSFEVERISNCTLYRGEMEAVLPTLASIDAIVTDPPYGIQTSGYWPGCSERWASRVPTDYGKVQWDEIPPDGDTIRALRACSKYQIIFGGNYFEGLGPTSCWLVWDKEAIGAFADCELAWTNLKQTVRRFRYLWSGFRKAKPERRYHPTQKPIEVMVWCLQQLPNDCQTICDPYMGVGSTGIAVIERGWRFIGIEKETRYFDIACRRLTEASSQLDLFSQGQFPSPRQEVLL